MEFKTNPPPTVNNPKANTKIKANLRVNLTINAKLSHQRKRNYTKFQTWPRRDSNPMG